MPVDTNWLDFFDLDKCGWVWRGQQPSIRGQGHRGDDEYSISTTVWGATLKNWRHAASTPEFLDFKIKDRDSWADAKAE